MRNVAARNLTILKAEAMRKDKHFLSVALDDCLAYSNGKCMALNELYCKKNECPFYKWGDKKNENISICNN